MARGAEYFRHPVELRSRPEVRMMIEKYSGNGYCFVLCFFEILASSPNFTVHTAQLEWGRMAKEFGIPKEQLTPMFKFAIKSDIIQAEKAVGGRLVSSELLNRRGLAEIISQRNRVARKKAPKPVPTKVSAEPVERKDHLNNYMARPKDAAMVADYMAKCGVDQPKVNGEKFFNHYQSIDWVRGTARTPITDWKALVKTWKLPTEETEKAKNGKPKQTQKEKIKKAGPFKS
jgi:hypothetical protein